MVRVGAAALMQAGRAGGCTGRLCAGSVWDITTPYGGNVRCVIGKHWCERGLKTSRARFL
eukprot:6179388-Pyramimonas_sp.AAC.1